MTTRVRHTAPPTPFGCRWCGEQQGHHGSSYVASVGMHRWARPTDAQMKARMIARRTGRSRA